jgi:uncharacterized membrane protein YfcA
VASYLWLVPFGFLIGLYGTLIGAGGGFVLVPLLLLFYPHESSEIITSIALAVVCCNAFSGSASYARMRRIDYRSGLLFSIASIPGAVLGALTTPLIPRRMFDGVFSLLMIGASVYLILRPDKKPAPEGPANAQNLHRHIVDAQGRSHTFSYNPATGLGASLLIGYFSSLLGIGGGIIHVPVLVHLLNFPVHVATATSHFVLAITALAGTVVHLATGAFHHGVRRTILLALGVVLGAPLGARLSQRIHDAWIIRSLGIALGVIGIRLMLAVI